MIVQYNIVGTKTRTVDNTHSIKLLMCCALKSFKPVYRDGLALLLYYDSLAPHLCNGGVWFQVYSFLIVFIFSGIYHIYYQQL